MSYLKLQSNQSHHMILKVYLQQEDSDQEFQISQLGRKVSDPLQILILQTGFSKIPTRWLIQLLQLKQYKTSIMKKQETSDALNCYILYPHTPQQKSSQGFTEVIFPESQSGRKKTRTRKLKRKSSKSSGYNWSLSENKSYLKFLLTHKNIFHLSLKEKKKIKVNVLLSKKIPSRTSMQCHSHHQKMVLKYGSIEKVIQELNKIFNLQLAKYQQSSPHFIKHQQNQLHEFFVKNQDKSINWKVKNGSLCPSESLPIKWGDHLEQEVQK